jgi:GNAT superfamily N-acetyltransferase
MTAEDILALFDAERQALTPASNVRQADGNVVRHLPSAGAQYWISYSRHSPDEIDAAIAREIEHLKSLSPRYTSLEWKAYDHDAPVNLIERLAAHGFEIGEREAFLALHVKDAPADLLAPVSLDVRRVTDAQGVRDYFDVSARVFDRDYTGWAGELEKQVIAGDPSVSVYVAYDGDMPVSSARITYDPGSQFAGLWGGATLASHRGKGYYTALVAARLQEALQHGVRFLYIDASPMSRPILERRGFVFLGYSRPCVFRSPLSQSSAES